MRRRVLTFLLLSGGGLLVGQQVVSERAATRFLEQASWGPTSSSVAHVERIGFENWLEQQFAMLPSPIGTGLVGNKSLRPVQQQFFVNALIGRDQLRQRVAFALSQLWVVSGVKINQPIALVPYLRMLSRDAFGNYLDLMRDVTLSPAMGHYLDMVNNNKPGPGTSANENYARELMQLFTVGEALLNEDGTPMLDRNGQSIPTYTQDTVTNLARVFTGWTYAPAPGAASHIHNPPYWDAPMIAYAQNHDMGVKALLNGVALIPNQTPETDLEGALGNLFNHPNVGPFVAKQLIQHLVVSNPSPAYVARVAAAFADNGAGVRGDLRAVVKAILLDQEARAEDDAASVTPHGGHLREPVVFLLALLRTLGATVTGANNLPSYASNMGQNVYFAPSVFNYFSPNYHVPGTALLGPEFQIQSTATALTRANFVNTLVFGNVGAGTTIDLAPWTALAGNPEKLVDTLGARFLHGDLPPEMRNAILTAVGAAGSAKLKGQTALYLVASSSLYQVEH